MRFRESYPCCCGLIWVCGGRTLATMELRPGDLGGPDVPALVEVLRLNGRYDYPQIEGPEAMKRVAKYESAVFLVAESMGKPCGFARAVYDGSRALIHLLSVHPDRQGRGIGSSLVEAAWEELWRRGAPTVSATITEDSFGFWEKSGFERTPAFLVLRKGVEEKAAFPLMVES